MIKGSGIRMRKVVYLSSGTFFKLLDLQRRKYPKTSSGTDLISAMIDDLSKDFEP